MKSIVFGINYTYSFNNLDVYPFRGIKNPKFN